MVPKSVLFTFSLLGLFGCKEQVIVANQGWSLQDQKQAFTLTEGSEMMPYDWFMALEKAESPGKFVQGLSSYGLIPSRKIDPEGSALPVGFTINESAADETVFAEKKWVGINCTACHTGLLKINGRELVINGSGGQFQFQRFQDDLLRSMDRTLIDKDKLARFLRAQPAGADLQTLTARFQGFRDEFEKYLNRSMRYRDQDGKVIPLGPGQVDGVGGPNNQTLCHTTPDLGSQKMRDLLSDPRNCRSSMAPANIPHLWGASSLQWVQWAGFVHSALGRNFGQAQGVFAKNWFQEDTEGRPIYRAGANLENLLRLEELFNKLNTPTWADLVDQKVVAPVDVVKAGRGRRIYEKNCLACHAVQPELTSPNKYGYTFWQVQMVPTAEIGTDPLQVQQVYARTSYLPDLLKEEFKKIFGEQSVKEDGTVNSFSYRSFTVIKQLNTAFDLLRYSAAERLKASGCRERISQGVVGYRARSLEGVVFTAPYLHNGSVPTLMDLLKPAAERPTDFYLGCPEYDVQNMGFACSAASAQADRFDTRITGMSNAGHEYGTQLMEDEKYELIEFLKTLTQPRRPPRDSAGPCG